MEEKEKTTVVSLGFIKGGVGKTNISILLATHRMGGKNDYK